MKNARQLLDKLIIREAIKTFPDLSEPQAVTKFLDTPRGQKWYELKHDSRAHAPDGETVAAFTKRQLALPFTA